ncbi:hypothetical protein D3C85_1071620 [compost metagenome]
MLVEVHQVVTVLLEHLIVVVLVVEEVIIELAETVLLMAVLGALEREHQVILIVLAEAQEILVELD